MSASSFSVFLQTNKTLPRHKLFVVSLYLVAMVSRGALLFLLTSGPPAQKLWSINTWCADTRQVRSRSIKQVLLCFSVNSFVPPFMSLFFRDVAWKNILLHVFVIHVPFSSIWFGLILYYVKRNNTPNVFLTACRKILNQSQTLRNQSLDIRPTQLVMAKRCWQTQTSLNSIL